MTVPTKTSDLSRTVRVLVRPRDRVALQLGAVEAAAVLRAGFGPACTAVTDVATRNDGWTASLVFDVRKAPEAALLLAHPHDDRLWRSWIESLCSVGVCDVLG